MTKKNQRKIFASQKIPLYNTDNMTVEQIANVKEHLDSYDWEDVTAQSLTDAIEDTVMKFCDL